MVSESQIAMKGKLVSDRVALVAGRQSHKLEAKEEAKADCEMEREADANCEVDAVCEQASLEVAPAKVWQREASVPWC